MGKYLFVVRSEPTDGKEEAYNDWYDNVHLVDVLGLPGFTAAQRFRIVGEPFAGEGGHRYLAIYELETDDPQASLDALSAAARSGAISITAAINEGDISAVLFEPIGDRVVASKKCLGDHD